MKRIIWLLAVMLALCGCTAAGPGESSAPTTQPLPEATETTEPAGIYEAFSDLEIRTGGAVRCFLPDEADVYGMRLLNGDVLVFSGTECTTLTRYTGQTLTPAGQITLDCRIKPEDSAFQTSTHGITYYDPNANTLVYLDNDLKEVSRLKLTEDLMGKPVLSDDRGLVYYCTADAVRVFDCATGLDRLLKSVSYPFQTVGGVLMDGRVLRCVLTDDHGLEYEIFLSTQTGALVAQIQQGLAVGDHEGLWCAKIRDGLLEQVLFGREGEPEQALYPADPFARSWFLPESGSAVTASVGDSATVLERYDLHTGLRTAAVDLPGGVEPWYVESNSGDGRVYLLAFDQLSGGPVVLSWDWTASPTGDEKVYTAPRYTADSPDEAGLGDCAARAAALGEKYGLKILVGRDGAAVQPQDYTLEYEHHVSLLQRELDALETLLEKFPQDFFRTLHDQISVCLVRSITGTAQSGNVAQAGGIQFWKGQRAYVVLAVGDSLSRSFCHELFHIIDGKVLSTNNVYYHWENLNPEGCKYFEDFTSYLTADVSQYLEGENRAFIDAYSMCYPREDRARIMEYACMEGNAHYFQSEIMQNKLKTLCQGIRKTFGLTKYEEPLLWEQYLSNPLT